MDNDCGNIVPTVELDGDGDGLSSCGGDCDDVAPTTFPGAPELCDGLDNDCNGASPRMRSMVTVTPSPPARAVRRRGPDDVPGRAGACDGIDHDCDGQDPHHLPGPGRDGTAICAGDCDDLDSLTFPGAPERATASTTTATSLPVVETDDDGDSLSDCARTATMARGCLPGAPELCDGVDNDCNGVIPTSELDEQDGSSTCEATATTGPVGVPGCPLLCGSTDTDCGVWASARWTVTGRLSVCDGDCDDAASTVFPAPTSCATASTAFDGSVLALADGDGDGFATCWGLRRLHGHHLPRRTRAVQRGR